MSAALRRPCPSCGEEVPALWVEADPWRELRCGLCGLTLRRVPLGQEAAPATGDEGAPAGGATQRSLGDAPPLLALAEDSKLLRTMVADHLQRRFPKAQFVLGADGRETLAGVARALRNGPRRGVVILDLQMPRLNGLATASALRAVEDGLERTPRLPVIFFSAVKANDALRQAMTEANPAAYLHKDEAGDAAAMLARLEQVMALVIRRAYES